MIFTFKMIFFRKILLSLKYCILGDFVLNAKLSALLLIYERLMRLSLVD